jgi:hypothetical protein
MQWVCAAGLTLAAFGTDAAPPSQPRCRKDALESWYCAKDPRGVAVLDNLGKVVCSPGRCVEAEDEWWCSGLSGGGAALSPRGPVCEGGCSAPRAVDCERGLDAASPAP